MEQKGHKELCEGQKTGKYCVGMTDKSNKIVIIDPEGYIKMGEVHTSKDVEVDMSTVEEMAALHDCHTGMIIKILGLGEGHCHKGRFRESYLGGAEPKCDVPSSKGS